MIENPAIFSVMSAQPILHMERLALLERPRIGLSERLQVLWVYPLRPAISQFLLEGPAREFQPGPIDVCVSLVRPRRPDHDGRGVGNQPKALFAFAQGCFCQLGESNVSGDLGGADDLARPISQG